MMLPHKNGSVDLSPILVTNKLYQTPVLKQIVHSIHKLALIGEKTQ